MAEVQLDLDRAASGLPAICAVTGLAADGAIPLKTSRSMRRPTAATIRVPLSQRVFQKWSRRQSVHLKARAVASVLTVVGIAVCTRNPRVGLVIIGGAVIIHLADLWADRAAQKLRPELHKTGPTWTLTGVHDDFVDAVVAANVGQRAEPASR